MKNKMNLMILSFAFIAIGCSTQKETAEQDKKNGPPSIEELMKMDADGNGKLSLDEVKGPLKDNFAKLDLDKDGFLTKEELSKAPKPERGQGPPRN